MEKTYYLPNWTVGSWYYRWETGEYEYHMSRPEWDVPDHRTCPCCVNKLRSRIKGPKALRIHNGVCVKSP